MNNKGFAVTTMVYASIVLLAMAMFSVLAIESAKYGNQKEFVEDINDALTECLGRNKF